ncbi:hypothetical protein SBI_02261 [Streptomyces bingchenggensis BCW-1]|uniref:Uncharacterized protein n=1 Tax=Streptomyces bingchenggensis (strain BCW-1) TaxID=749414 RepID=D7BV03_STRBB|nr:hypothetical protein SBI_02261 [Streptomyces bingchenggensis BCW-1]
MLAETPRSDAGRDGGALRLDGSAREQKTTVRPEASTAG